MIQRTPRNRGRKIADFHKTVNRQFVEIHKLGKTNSQISGNQQKNHMYGLWSRENQVLLQIKLNFVARKIKFYGRKKLLLQVKNFVEKNLIYKKYSYLNQIFVAKKNLAEKKNDL